VVIMRRRATAGSSGAWFRRARDLVVYWDAQGLVLENYAARRRVGVDPVVCRVLDCFHDWQTMPAALSRLREYDPASVRASIHQLAGHGFLERSHRPRAGSASLWPEWGPAAAYFHFSTKDATYITAPAAERRFFNGRAARVPIPSSVKRYLRAPQIPLPSPQTAAELPRILLERRTWRRFSQQPLSLTALGTLLGLTWGVQRWHQTRGGRLAEKTSPSGGARHPVEVYVLALRVRGLPRGLYHYRMDAHRLERLARGGSAQQVERFLGGQAWFRGAAALFLMTAVFPRTQWSYPYPRAYRVVLADAGHLGQTFCLLATWLGLAPFTTMALADSRIERALGVDGVNESVLYAAGVGLPPGDERAAGDV
jgi:SagB-type dehydrogenase family enzyme